MSAFTRGFVRGLEFGLVFCLFISGFAVIVWLGSLL